MDELRLTIHGRVQGVFFRQTITGWAEELDLTGYVVNCANGSVKVCAQGVRSALETLRLKCYDGPELAEVSRVEVEWQQAPKTYPSFTIESEETVEL